MQYQLAPIFCRPWTLNGISPRLIESHYEHNYGAALNRLNALTDELESLDVGKTPASVFGRLKREQTDALNAMLLLAQPRAASKLAGGFGAHLLSRESIRQIESETPS